jgi:nucleolar GTP-binding protein
MNFQKIAPVENITDILDQAFRKARIKGKQKNLKGNWLQIIRKKESLKLDIVKSIIEEKLMKISNNFPDLDVLPNFYIKLMKITLDYSEFKQALGAVKWAVQRNRNLHKDFVRKINHEKENVNNLTKQYYGRIASILKQISSQMKFLEKSRKTMRSYPDIKEMFTICIYGFPNVGKTTLLNKLAKTKAETAAYAFTTKSINAGYFTIKDKKVQVFDVPGTLARDNKLNNIEKQAELVLNELADLVIYVYDLTESCGYSLEKQKMLRKKLSNRDVLVYLSKKDLMTLEDKNKLTIKSYDIEQIKKEINKKT